MSLSLQPESPSREQTKAAAPLDVLVLTRRMKEGDEMAYRMFHDAYFGRLSRYLLVVANGDEQRMRDAVQETYRRVVKHIRVFDEEPVFWSWLTVLARSALTDQQRKERRYFAFLERFTRHAPTEETPATESHSERMNETLDHSLSTLATDDRELVELKYFEHCSVREIAARLATSESAIESRLVRIRRKLKESILSTLNHESPT